MQIIKNMKIYEYVKDVVMEYLHDQLQAKACKCNITGKNIKEFFDEIKKNPCCLRGMQSHEVMLSNLYHYYYDEIFEIYFKKNGDIPTIIDVYKILEEVILLVLKELELEMDFSDDIVEELKTYENKWIKNSKIVNKILKEFKI